MGKKGRVEEGKESGRREDSGGERGKGGDGERKTKRKGKGKGRREDSGGKRVKGG